VIRRITRAGGERFQVYGQRAGRKVYVGTFDSRREALSADRRHVVTQEQIAAGELPPEVDQKRTVTTALEAWLASLAAGKSRSHRAYSEFVRYQITPHLGTEILARVNKPRVMRWRDELAGEYAPTTVNSALASLSAAFTYFVDRGWIPANACRGVRQLEVPARAYNWIKTRPELERLLLSCHDELRDMVAIAVGTCMRLDEMLHLAWDDVDLEARLITVQRGRQGTVKGGRIRHVPILDAVLPVLRQRALRRAGDVLVFPGRRRRVRAKNPVQCAYKAALKRAGLDPSLRWHDLRHTGASWWVLGGGDIFRLSRLLGHASVTITQKVYAHLAPEAWQQDYHRLAFDVPSEPAKLYEIRRDDRGKLAGRRVRSVDAAEIVGSTSSKSA
jgi:integrase